MRIVNQILNEAKKVGLIYHFTGIGKLARILQDNQINANSDTIITNIKNKKEIIGVSTTRNKNFWNEGQKLIGTSKINVKIILDGDKISNKFQIIPFNAFHGKDLGSKIINPARDIKKPERIEAEEKIITPRYGLKNLSNFVVGIEIKTNKNIEKFFLQELKQIRNICLEKNINLKEII